MSILTFDNVSKVFYSKTQQTVAVEGLSFCVDEGQFVAIIGPSGCGKTTILSLVCGLIQPTSGKVSFEKPNSRVGYMLQRDQLFEWRTIEKNVLLGLEIRGKVRDEDKEFVHELLKKYGLWEFRKHYPQELSGGMRQRAALIRTLATRPDLLLLDEPFSALDFQTRLSVCDDVYSIIREEHKTALLVTHDISEAISMADTVIVLTARPAKVLTTHQTELGDIKTPLKRRESPTFAKQFETLHKYLSGASITTEDGV